LLGRSIESKRTNPAPVTFIVHASKNDEVTITVRLRAVAAIAKAQSLSAEGWDVVIIGPDDLKYSPAEFVKLLAFSAP
jgi:precorrin-4 methylase